jgi:hypothetical protein
MRQGTTVTSQVWQHNKKRGMLTSGVVLLHDNMRPHTAAHTRALLEHFQLAAVRPPSLHS